MSKRWDKVKNRKKFNTKDGFTLIEIMVSLSIMSVSIVTILQLFSGGLRSIKISDDYLRAIILARNKMFQIEKQNTVLLGDKGSFKEDDRYKWLLSVEDYDLKELHPQFGKLKDADKEKEKEKEIGEKTEKENEWQRTIFVDKITLKVFWNTNQGQRKIELTTLKTFTTVNPASQMTLQNKYKPIMRISRGLQFGDQDLPENQSGNKYTRSNISGTKMVLKNRSICGSSTDIKIAICGN